MKYTINYGCGIATLYTPHDPEKRFNTLANTCFGIRKSILCFEILKTEDMPCPAPDYERLEFSGDVYIWRKDGARKMLAPYPDDEWDTDYCDECRAEEENNMERVTKRCGPDTVVYIGESCQFDDGDIPAEIITAGVRDILRRLAAYEDTGLAPEEIAALMNPATQKITDAIVEAIPQLVQFIIENAPKLVAAQAPGPVQMETLLTIQDELIIPQDESMRWLASRFGRRA